MIGTQQLVKSVPFREQVEQTRELQSNIIKCRYDEDGLDEILDDPSFKYYFFWFRSNGKNFTSGEVDEETEYKETFQAVWKVLDRCKDQDKVFFFGNWEGDWYLLPEKNKSIDAEPQRVQGMIKWHQVRYRAIEDVRRISSNFNPQIYYYIEMNRVTDAWDLKMKRLVNSVLPHVKTDFVSLSSWELQEKSTDEIASIFDYINSYANYSDVKTPWKQRIFIGEFGIPSVRFEYNDSKHCEENIKIYKKFRTLGCPFILYWAMHNNEYKPDGRPKGLWLIDQFGSRTQLFQEIQKMCLEQS